MSPQRDSSRWQIGIILKWFVSLHMYPQRTSVRGCKFTLVAFVWLFSTVYFQMCPQIACLSRGKVTLVAFVWLFSTVYFQMCPQIACLGRGKITLVAFVLFFSTVRFQVDWTLSPRKHLELACPSVSGLYLTDSKLSHGSTHWGHILCCHNRWQTRRHFDREKDASSWGHNVQRADVKPLRLSLWPPWQARRRLDEAD